MTGAIIKNIEAREIFDSRGNPTVSVTVQTENRAGTFDVPSGASTGTHEALELRDNDGARFGGKGVLLAVKNVNEIIAPKLFGADVHSQREIDNLLIDLDGTRDKSRLGANAILGVSIACAKAAAAEAGTQTFEYLRVLGDMRASRKTPYLFMNLINGGLHAHSRLAFQEYMVVPQTDDAKEALDIGIAIMNELEDIIHAKFPELPINIGDEGGFALDTDDVELPLGLLVDAAERTGNGSKIKLALDVAASSFFKDGKYIVGEKALLADELTAVYKKIISKYPIISIEDPFYEEAFGDFAKLNDGKILVIGDDLTTTNKERLMEAINKKSVSGLIIKPNQVGTLSETIDTMKFARANGMECIVSHRSGETKDDFIADLAYAFGAFGLKSGAPRQEERMAKYNRLLTLS